MCYLCLCSQQYIVVHIELVDFLRLWWQLEQQRCCLTTQQLKKFLAVQPIWCCFWCSENLLHRSTLRFMAAVASSFCAIVATSVLASITSSNYVGRSLEPGALAGRAWEWGWEWDCEILHTCPILVVYCHRWLKGAPRVHSVHVNIPKLWKFVTSFPDSSPAI